MTLKLIFEPNPIGMNELRHIQKHTLYNEKLLIFFIDQSRNRR